MILTAQLKTVFIIAVTTARMIFPGLPPTLSTDEAATATKSLTMDLTSESKAGKKGKATCTVPEGLGQGKPVKLTIVPFKPSTPGSKAKSGQKSTSKSPKLTAYWGSEDAVPVGQPKQISPDDVTPPPNAPRAPAAPVWASYAYWPGRDAKQVTDDSSASGAYKLVTNYCGGTTVTLGDDQNFLAPIVLIGMNGKINLAKAISIRWNNVPGAMAYLVTASGGNEKGTIVWASSTNPKWATTPDVTNRALTKAELDRLVKDGILLSPKEISCTIPAGIFRNVGTAMLTITAIGADKIQTKDGIETNIIVRSRASLPLTDYGIERTIEKDTPPPAPGVKN